MRYANVCVVENSINSILFKHLFKLKVAEMFNSDTKLYIASYTNSKKSKIVNLTSSPQTNEHN